MKEFKKYKYLICGALIGAAVSTAIPVLAENVSVVVDRTIKLIIAGEYKTLPADYEVLNYKDRTYLPSRYVAEELGATVLWDDSSRTITITKPAPEIVEKIVEVPVEVEKIVYRDRPVADSSVSYRNLPVNQTYDNMTITLHSIHTISTSTNDITRISFELKNDNEQYLAGIDYSGVELVADGTTYRTSSVPANMWDSKFMYEDVGTKSSASGFFVFPKVNVSATEFTVKVPVRVQGKGTTNNYDIMFYATLNE